MPRKRLPPRLYLRQARNGREPVWVILDGPAEISTGCGAGDEREAQKALGQYLIERATAPSPTPRHIHLIGDALAFYAERHAPHTADPARISYCIDALAMFWGQRPIADVTGDTCRRYAKEREVSTGTIRRELGCLRAALVFCEAEGRIPKAPRVTLPAKPEPKQRWMTRDEVAKLIRAARKTRATHHLARFILIAVYTGTRPGSILTLQWRANSQGGHVDCRAGLLYRASQGARSSKKRTPPVRLPRQLLAHLRRWQKLGGTYVIESRGQRCLRINVGWRGIASRAKVTDTTPHTCRHTAATWLMQRGADQWHAAGFLGMSRETLETVYGHHHPDHQDTAVRAMERR